MVVARPCGVEAKHGQVLHVLGQGEGAGLEHEDAFTALGAPKPQVLGQGAAEGAAPDDDEVERPQVARAGSPAAARTPGSDARRASSKVLQT